jgi:deoxyguanosinetriphosphate triphosphohydrolase, putative
MCYSTNYLAANPLHFERKIDELDHHYRSRFIRDRDRILYSKAFRRLSGKTQVFGPTEDAHFRTRLTHTLEVAQIATTICKYLELNEELAEAISLGHDIGHTPFGHVGERVLNNISNNCDIVSNHNIYVNSDNRGFKHNLQSIRIVTEIGIYSSLYEGLNLTNATLWGMMNHSSTQWGECEMCIRNKCMLKHGTNQCPNKKRYSRKRPIKELSVYNSIIPDNENWSLEALVVKWADEIAQRHHDIEDGLISHIVNKDEFINLFETSFKKNGIWNDNTHGKALEEIKSEQIRDIYIPLISKFIVDFYVNNFVVYAKKKLLEDICINYKINSRESFDKQRMSIWNTIDVRRIISFNSEFEENDKIIKKFLMNRIINSRFAQVMDGKGTFILRRLVNAYLNTPSQLPDKTISHLFINLGEIDKKSAFDPKNAGELRNKLEQHHTRYFESSYQNILVRTIIDYIAGMTDEYAIVQYEKLYGINRKNI